MELNLILGTMGFGTIDENLQGLISSMSDFPESTILGTVQGWAKIIGLCIAIGVGSYECWMMMLGRRGMDVMKILHIIIISICITSASWICEAAAYPGKALGEAAGAMATSQNEEVKNLEATVAEKQQEYSEHLRKKIVDIYEKEKAAKAVENDGGSFLGIEEAWDEFKRDTEIALKQATFSIETTICEWVSIAIRFIGEVLFQVIYYGMLLASIIFLHLLTAFCPLAFALSLAPPFRSAWSQWLSKYLSISLWGFVIYMIMYYVCYIMQYNLSMDITAYDHLMKGADGSSQVTGEWGEILMLGMQGLGTTCMYVVGLLIGGFLMSFVPDVASWLIPGGVGSPIGGAMVGAASSGSTMGASMALGAAGALLSGGQSVAGALGSRAGENLSGAHLPSLPERIGDKE